MTPLAVDNVGYPDNHTSPDEREEFWWETFNPMLHPILQTMTVDGHFLPRRALIGFSLLESFCLFVLYGYKRPARYPGLGLHTR